MTSPNRHLTKSKENLYNLQKEQQNGTFIRDILLINRTTNNINYIDELENIVNELQYLETLTCHPISKFEIPLIPHYSSVKRFETLLQIIKHQEERISKLERIINK